MIPGPATFCFPSTALRIARAVLFATRMPGRRLAIPLLAATLAASSCREKPSTPAWSQSTGTAQTTTAPAAQIPPAHGKKRKSPAPAATADPESPDPDRLRFVAYNVANYLTMDRFLHGQQETARPKPDSEKSAVTAVIANQHPDVVGLCEIGTQDDLRDLQQRLKNAGCDLPHAHYTGGVDPTRHLALLSRFPITPHAPQHPLTYPLAGSTRGMQRGILDISLDLNGQSWRFVGAHLKSKRQTPDANESETRGQEARLLRAHTEAILREQPDTRLVVYGDLNDTRDSPALHTLQGPNGAPDALTPLFLKDSHGDSWTEYWGREDIYSRIDWILVSQAAKRATVLRSCHIADPPYWNDASDHRALFAVFHN